MIDRNKLKKSDLKQYDNAWMNFYRRMAELIEAVKELEEIEDGEFSIDDINQISNRVEKLTKTIKRVGDCIN